MGTSIINGGFVGHCWTNDRQWGILGASKGQGSLLATPLVTSKNSDAFLSK